MSSELYDDTNGRDLPDISDLIEGGEEIQSLDDFLDRKTRSSETVEPRTDLDAAISDHLVENMRREDEASRQTPSPVPPVTSHQDSRPNGIVPEPVLVNDKPNTPFIDSPADTKTHLEIRTHPIVGTYLSETTLITGTDDWYADVFLNAKNLGVTGMTADQIVEKIHQNDEAIRRTKTVSQGLRAALEEHLSKMNASQRASILEKDQQYRAKKIKSDEKRAESQSTRKATSKSGTKAAGADQKAVKTLKETLGMSKDAVETEMKQRGKLNADLQSYINTVYGQV